jgi:hypothetical protein
MFTSSFPLCYTLYLLLLVKTGDGLKFYTDETKSGGLYKRQLKKEDKAWADFDHPHEPTLNMYEYNDVKISGDRRVSYASSKYPWIDSVGVYEHLKHLPSDYDAVQVDVSGRDGPGHYIVHWRWNGYSDCTDVDFFDDQQVTSKYGTDNQKFIWNRIDHCQYVEPRNLVTPCLHSPAGEGGAPCKKIIDELFTGHRNENTQKGWDSARIGINVVPLQNDKNVAFSEAEMPPNIPWHDADERNVDTRMANQCTGGLIPFRKQYTTPWTTLGGTETSTAVNWAAWKKTITYNTACDTADMLWEATTTLRDAVLRCTAATCGAIAWQSNGGAGFAKAQTGSHVFRGCPPGKTIAEPVENTWTLFTKNIPAVAAISPPTLVAQISFQPAGTASTIGGFTADEGSVYGTRDGGGEYGWNCDTSERMTWNKIGTMNQHNSYMMDMQATPCPDGSQRRWEMKVPKGVYRITTYHARERGINEFQFVAGCNFENVKLDRGSSGGRIADGTTIVVNDVEVTDGRLTFQSPERTFFEGAINRIRCNVINYIKVQQIGTKLPSAWLPSSQNPFWQLEVEGGGTTALGLVTVSLPDVAGMSVTANDDCRSWWLWRGDKCPAAARQLDTFDINGDGDEGAVVVVTDKACGAAGCPALNADRTAVVGDASSTVCKIITRTTRCPRVIQSGTTRQRNMEYRLCPIEVDCKGAIGKYVQLRLPSGATRKTNRILDATVKVFRAKPTISLQAQEFVCYGLEAGLSSETKPEFVITDDSSDPAFFSTCFVREKDITFLPVDTKITTAKARWKFAGKCLNCRSFAHAAGLGQPDPSLNATAKAAANMFEATRWTLDARCVDCEALVAAGVPVDTIVALGQPSEILTEKEQVAAATTALGTLPTAAWEGLHQEAGASKTESSSADTSSVNVPLAEIIIGSVGGALLLIFLAVYVIRAKAGTVGGKLKNALTQSQSFYVAQKPKKDELRAYVMYEYTAGAADELSLVRGDRIVVLQRPDEDGWGVGRLADGTEGKFPGSYVTIAEQQGMSQSESRKGAVQMTQSKKSRRDRLPSLLTANV